MRNKIGPNEKCPCGSGKKYKKCCASKGIKSLVNSYEDQTDRIYELINKRDFQGARAMLINIPKNRSQSTDLKKASLIISAALDESDAISLNNYSRIIDEALALSVGTLMYERHCYERAIEWLKKAIELNPKNPNAYMNLGASFLGLNFYKKALSVFLELEKILGYSSSVYINIAHCYASLNQTAEAKKTLAKVKESERTKPAYLSAIAGLNVANEEWELAKDLYAELCKQFPFNEGMRFSYFNTLAELKDASFQSVKEELVKNLNQTNVDRFLDIELTYYVNKNDLSFYIHELEERISAGFLTEKMFFQLMHVYAALGDTEKVLVNENKYLEQTKRHGSIFGLTWSLCSAHLNEATILKKHEEVLWGLLPHCPELGVIESKNRGAKLKVGYISSDFREHPVADFIEPILRKHNKEKIEVICFSANPRDDDRTTILKGFSDHWEHIRGLDQASIVKLITSCNLDILIDLNGMTDGTNSEIFNCRMARAQIGWIGYAFSTPAKEMDYRIVDNKTDPVGLTEDFYTEQLLRLPKTFSVFLPNSSLKLVKPKAEAPCIKNGFITFGSLNNLAKVTDEMMRCWAQILNKVPNSRLFFKAPQFKFTEAKTRISQFFETSGISADRLQLTANFETKLEGYEALKKIDVCLDTSPYNGTTTTCETLYMGVPVVTLIGDSHRSRVSYSQLSSIGLEELAGETFEDYVKIAVRLATDRNYLKSIRSGLRE